MIEKLGVTIKHEQGAGQGLHPGRACKEKGFEAVFLGVGRAEAASAWASRARTRRASIEAIDFLREYNLTGKAPVGKNVVVVGGGNAADRRGAHRAAAGREDR